LAFESHLSTQFFAVSQRKQRGELSKATTNWVQRTSDAVHLGFLAETRLCHADTMGESVEHEITQPNLESVSIPQAAI